jgi:sucrose-6-phosphate hydrolase SacC (GH32 family)
MIETGNAAIARAMESVQAAVPKARQDPERPVYHFRPPANWMNDPNGTIYHNGYYHLFYQHNPYGDEWGHMHWGHARSRDLVHWEHLPIALWPSLELGEAHVFSGCAAVNGDGQPVLFYTSVGPGKNGQRPDNQQWAALGDADWITWEKHPQNPVLSFENHGGPRFTSEWRDPYIFSEGGRTFMVLGVAEGDTAGVALYEAQDDSLINWRYHKLLYQKPTSEIRFFECPNFFKVNDIWVLLTSPYETIRYYTGTFDLDTLTFTPQHEGILDSGQSGEGWPNFYASNTLYDPEGRCILLGWVRNFPPGRGWNGCLALPRVFTVGADGRPRQQPIEALAELRAGQHSFTNLALDEEVLLLEDVKGTQLEIQATLQRGSAQRVGIVLRSDTSRQGGASIVYDGTTLTVADSPVSVPSCANTPINLHIFLDRSVLEVFVNDGEVAVTRVIEVAQENQGVALFAEGGRAQVSQLEIWTLAAIEE